MLSSYSEADANTNEPIIQPKTYDTSEEEEDEFGNSEEIRQMFNKYVSALSGDNKEREMIEEEISEEELDSYHVVLLNINHLFSTIYYSPAGHSDYKRLKQGLSTFICK